MQEWDDVFYHLSELPIKVNFPSYPHQLMEYILNLSTLDYYVPVEATCVNAEDIDIIGDASVRECVEINLCTFMKDFDNVLHDKDPNFLITSGLNIYVTQLPIITIDENKEIHVDRNFRDFFTMPMFFKKIGSLLRQCNLWINVLICQGNLHYDCDDNILAVLKGEKEVILISPRYTKYLLANPCCWATGNHSRLTFDDVLKLPDEMKMVFKLSAGEYLYIPNGWWHCVRSNKCTIAINFWFESILTSPTSPIFQRDIEAFALRNLLSRLVSECISDQYKEFMNSIVLLDQYELFAEHFMNESNGHAIMSCSFESMIKWCPRLAKEVRYRSCHASVYI